MPVESVLICLTIGALAGWLAGLVVKGYGFGVVRNIIVGVVGSMVGGALCSRVHLLHAGGLVGSLIGATLGAVLLLLMIRLLPRRSLMQRLFQRN